MQRADQLAQRRDTEAWVARQAGRQMLVVGRIGSAMERHDDVGEGALGADVRGGVGLAALDLLDDLLRRVPALEHVALELPSAPELLLGLEEDGDVDRDRASPRSASGSSPSTITISPGSTVSSSPNVPGVVLVGRLGRPRVPPRAPEGARPAGPCGWSPGASGRHAEPARVGAVVPVVVVGAHPRDAPHAEHVLHTPRERALARRAVAREREQQRPVRRRHPRAVARSRAEGAVPSMAATLPHARVRLRAPATGGESMDDRIQLWNDLAAQIGVDSIRCTTAAGSGHPTSSMSCAHLLSVLVADHLRYRRGRPEVASRTTGSCCRRATPRRPCTRR